MEFRGVIFDMDGTLTVPAIDFAAMRARLGIPAGDILAIIRDWEPDRRSWAFAVIEELEAVARDRLELQPGALDLVRLLDQRGIAKALMTRNTRLTADFLMERMAVRFEPVLTREFWPVKPSPEPALHISRSWGIAPADVLMVGDYRDDILCGQRAGMRTFLLLNDRNREYADLADWTGESLAELHAIVEGI